MVYRVEAPCRLLIDELLRHDRIIKLYLYIFVLFRKGMTDIQKQYRADADLMAIKPRFGYFSMMPSHTAAIPPPDHGKRIPP